METIHRLTIPVPFAVETVNVFVIKGDSLTLVDTGTNTPQALSALEKGLQELGYSIRDIETVVLTHHHVDHSGLLHIFSDDTAIIGHPRNEPWISQDSQFLQRYERFFHTAVEEFGVPRELSKGGGLATRTMTYASKRSLTHAIREGDEIAALPGFTVLEMPGHASTHVVLFREQDGLMIGGDLLLQHISSNPLLEPPYEEGQEREKPLLQYNTSLRRLAKLPISRIVTGHGSDVTEVASLVTARLQKQEARASKVLHMLKQQPLTAFEVCKELFPSLYTKQLSLTLSETVGQLDFLTYNQHIVPATAESEWKYYTK